MKRILITIALMSAAVFAGAQDIYSSMDLSGNQYTGTARTMAMGNAFTALGGDLGAISVNPAASAVSHYSQFVVSPGFSLSSTTASFAPTFKPKYGLTYSDFDNTQTHSQSKLRLPNIGSSLFIETGRDEGLTGFSFAVVSNSTGNYLDYFQTGGVNNETSISGAFASAAYGIPQSALKAADAFNYYDLNTIAAYRAYVISPLPGYEDEYYGAAETIDYGSIFTAGPLNQVSRQAITGTKNDLELNMGFNYSDRFMLGFSLGIPSVSYQYEETFIESAKKYTDFPLDDTYLDYITYQYQLNRSVSGVYGKFGAIWLPTETLRLGATFRTPTRYSISEEYDVYQALDLKNKTYSEDEEFGEFSYRLRSPYMVSVGIANTFASRALLSVDYELADYSVMKYTGNSKIYEALNAQNKLFCGLQHMLRVGGELFMTPSFAVRAGYTLTTSPLCYYADALGNTVTVNDFDYSDYRTGRQSLGAKTNVADRLHSVSFGLGYSSPGSFFMDVAARYSTRPTRDFVAYADYIYDDNGNVSVPSPTVRYGGKLWDVLVTFGWRF